ncbi:MAG: hypothetical protein V3U71_03950 [Cocleimonas sp.]
MSNYLRMRSIPFTPTLTLITSMVFTVLLAGCNGDDGKNKEPKAAVIRPVKTLTVA